MSSINLNNLQDTSKPNNAYTYVDFHLDFEEDKIGSTANFVETIASGRDIKVALDLNAIRNSLKNLFNTIPGERILLPDYGSDIRNYVFEPMTEILGKTIGDEITSAIGKWEPRVNLNSVDITGDPDLNEYTIVLYLEAPFLDEPLGITSMLSKDGYII
jgi:phage baseplate assembly protein W